MPKYTVTDPVSGKTMTLTGDSPPTEAELNQIFGAIGNTSEQYGELNAPPSSRISFQAEAPQEQPSFTKDVLQKTFKDAGGPDVLMALGMGGGTLLGGPAGSALGGGAAKYVGDILANGLPSNPNTKALGDVTSALEAEMVGQMLPKAAGFSLKQLTKVKDAGKLMLGKKGLGNELVKRSAAKQLDAAITKNNVVADQAAQNAQETAALAKRMGLDWNVGMGQATGDPKTLALQRRLLMNNDVAKTLNAEQSIQNHAAVSNVIDRNLPDGSVDDVIGALSKEKNARSKFALSMLTKAEKSAAGIEGAAKDEVGNALKDLAVNKKIQASQIADRLYSQVPRNLPIKDTSPLYDTISKLDMENDPAFQKLLPSLRNTTGRAGEALAPGSPIEIGANGLGFKSAPEPMTWGQLQDFRSQVTQAARQARSAGNYDVAYKFDQLTQAASDTAKMAETSGQGAAYNALKEANKFYRDTYVPTFRQGATSKVLAKDVTGAYKVDPATIGSQYFKKGANGIKAAEDFARTFGDDVTAKSAIKDYASQDLLAYARDPKTGEFNGGRINTWLNNHRDALGKLGLNDAFNGFKSAVRTAEEARGMETAFNKSRFAKAIDYADTQEAVKYLFGGENAVKPEKTMRQLIEMTSGDPAALNGLKRSFADFLKENSVNTVRDMANNRAISLAKNTKLMDKYMGAMKQLYNEQEIGALKDIQRALEIQGRIQSIPSGIAGSQTADLLGTPGQMVRQYLPLNPKWRILRTVINSFKKNYNEQVDEYLSHALYDPQVASQLKETARLAEKSHKRAISKMTSDVLSITGKTIAIKSTNDRL